MLLCVRILPSHSSQHGCVLTSAGDTIGSVTLPIGVVHFGSWLAGDISSVPETSSRCLVQSVAGLELPNIDQS